MKQSTERAVKSPSVAVIGSGFGGLAAAIRLQVAGARTTIYESRDKPGGRAYVYREDGFVFDAGPTVITDPSCIAELFEFAGRRMDGYVSLESVDPFYNLRWEDGFTFDYTNDPERLLGQIEARSPDDLAGYLDFLEYSNAVLQEGYSRLGHVPFLNFWSMVRVAPKLARLGCQRSVYSVVAKYIRDPHLRQAFSFHSLLVGGNPFSTSSIYALIHALEHRWGVYFPKGGTGALVQALVDLFTELGGEIRLETPVDAIETWNGSVTAVRTQNGESEHYDAVVSNADVVHTYSHLLRDCPQGRAKGRRLARKRMSNSLFIVYFGLSRTYPEVGHHTVLFGPRYKGLLQDIFDKGVLAEDFSLYLHAPSTTDPSLAPPGCSVFYVLAPVPHLGHGGIDWTVTGPAYRDRLLDYLERALLEDLRDNLVTCRFFTPLDFRDELNAYQGSAFSLEPVLTQSAYFRPHNRDGRIDGLYIVGAGTHPGAGIPGVIGSAKATSKLVQSDLGLAPVSEPLPMQPASGEVTAWQWTT